MRTIYSENYSFAMKCIPRVSEFTISNQTSGQVVRVRQIQTDVIFLTNNASMTLTSQMFNSTMVLGTAFPITVTYDRMCFHLYQFANDFFFFCRPEQVYTVISVTKWPFVNTSNFLTIKLIFGFDSELLVTSRNFNDPMTQQVCVFAIALCFSHTKNFHR